MNPQGPHRGESGTVVVPVLLLALLACAVAAWIASSRVTVDRSMYDVQTHGLPRADRNGPFAEHWSVKLDTPVVTDMAPSPWSPTEFFALNGRAILRFDMSGKTQGEFRVAFKPTRIVADATGSVPHLLVASTKKKFAGTITHLETTDLFLHAVDRHGNEVWQKRFDPKEVSALEPLATRLGGAPVVLLSTGQRIVCFDVSGRELWSTALWHHPGTVDVADIDGDGVEEVLAAQAPRREIMRLDARGRILGPWAEGDGPSRVRVSRLGPDVAAVSLRTVFGRNAGVVYALAFFDQQGHRVREVELPQDASPLSYSLIRVVDVDGRGPNQWATALADGSLHVYTAAGDRIARHVTGARLRTFLVMPQPSGPDLLITATHRGLTAWRPRLRQSGRARPDKTVLFGRFAPRTGFGEVSP